MAKRPRKDLKLAAAWLSARVGSSSAASFASSSSKASASTSSSSAEALASWLCGRTRSGRRLDEVAVATSSSSSASPASPASPSSSLRLLPHSLFGALGKTSIDFDALEAMLSRAPASTASRVASLETRVASLRKELLVLKKSGVVAPPSSAKAKSLPSSSSSPAAAAAAAATTATPSAPPPPQSPLEAFLAALDAAGEAEPWKEGFPGLGTLPEVPKLLRSAGRVRNKGITKRETERTVKEIWKERLAAAGMQHHSAAAGALPGATPLIDFVFLTCRSAWGSPRSR